MTTTRTYKTADEALEAANREVARLQYEWDMQRYSVFGVPIDKDRLNKPKQFAYEKPEPTTEPANPDPWEDAKALRRKLETVNDKGKMEQISITNWPETLKPDWEPVVVDRDGSVKPVDKLSYMQPANPDPWKDAEELRRKLEMELESHRRLKRQILGLDPYPPKITTPKPVHPLLDFPSVYASVQIEG